MQIKAIIGETDGGLSFFIVTDKNEIEIIDKDALLVDIGEAQYSLLKIAYEHIADVADSFWDEAEDIFMDYEDFRIGNYCNVTDYKAVFSNARKLGFDCLYDFLVVHERDGLRFLLNNYKALSRFFLE